MSVVVTLTGRRVAVHGDLLAGLSNLQAQVDGRVLADGQPHSPADFFREPRFTRPDLVPAGRKGEQSITAGMAGRRIAARSRIRVCRGHCRAGDYRAGRVRNRSRNAGGYLSVQRYGERKEEQSPAEMHSVL